MSKELITTGAKIHLKYFNPVKSKAVWVASWLSRSSSCSLVIIAFAPAECRQVTSARLLAPGRTSDHCRVYLRLTGGPCTKRGDFGVSRCMIPVSKRADAPVAIGWVDWQRGNSIGTKYRKQPLYDTAAQPSVGSLRP